MTTESKTTVIEADDQPKALSTGDLKGLMQQAITHGGTEAVEVVERLLGVAERVADREARASFNRAFAAFATECPIIPKSRTAGDATGAGSSFSFSYAPLEVIQKLTRPVLVKNGLSYRFSNEDLGGDAGTTRVVCTLSHVDGHSVETVVKVRKGGANRRIADSQQDAGALTTACRKALTLALGLTVDEDEPPPLPPVDAITPEQEATVHEWLEQLDLDARKRFMSWANVVRVADIPAHAYENVIAMLKRKAGQA